MPFTHSNIWIVRIVDTDEHNETTTWYAGPYGSTAADHTASRLEQLKTTGSRECFVEPLFADYDSLPVG